MFIVIGIKQKKILDHQIDVKEKELALTKEYKDRFMTILSVDQMIALGEAEDEFRRILLKRMKHRERGEKGEHRNDGKHKNRR